MLTSVSLIGFTLTCSVWQQTLKHNFLKSESEDLCFWHHFPNPEEDAAFYFLYFHGDNNFKQ